MEGGLTARAPLNLASLLCARSIRRYLSWATLQQVAFLFGKNWVAFAGAATALEVAFQKGLIARRS